MADRIDKTVLHTLTSLDQRVEASEDATHGQKQNAPEDDAEGQPQKDGFQKKSGGDPLLPLQKLEKAGLTQRIDLAEVQNAWFGEINLQSDPSTLICKIQLKQDHCFYIVKVPLSRAQALPLNTLKTDQVFALQNLFTDPQIWVQILKILPPDDEEVTRISAEQGADPTLSETFKMNPDVSFWQRIGLFEKATGRLNFEVLLAYITVLIVFCFLIFGLLYLIA